MPLDVSVSKKFLRVTPITCSGEDVNSAEVLDLPPTSPARFAGAEYWDIDALRPVLPT